MPALLPHADQSSLENGFIIGDDVTGGRHGVVFVADSHSDRAAANRDAFDELQENLAKYELNLEHVPHVIQYNKRDLPEALPIGEMREELNPFGALEFEANATSGRGVMETLKAILELVRNDIIERL